MRQEREIEIISNENGVVRFRVPETGQELTLPQAMDPARVDALIDGHIRAVQRGPQPKAQPSTMDVAVNRSGIPQALEAVIGGVKGLEGLVQGGGQMIRSAVPALNSLPSASYQRPEPPQGPAQEAGAILAQVGLAARPSKAVGAPVAGAAMTGWKALPPTVRDELVRTLVRVAGYGGAAATLKRLGAFD